MAKAASASLAPGEVLSRAFDTTTSAIDTGSSGAATHTAVNVTASSSTALAASATRRYLCLINDSDTDIYVTVENTAAALNAGIRLNANGGTFIFDGYCPTNAIKAIHGSSGNKVLLITTA